MHFYIYIYIYFFTPQSKLSKKIQTKTKKKEGREKQVNPGWHEIPQNRLENVQKMTTTNSLNYRLNKEVTTTRSIEFQGHKE